MQVESVPNIILNQNTEKTNELPVMDIKAIKTILYLGIKGNILLGEDKGKTVDTFA
jgi:hypothetical protein